MTDLTSLSLLEQLEGLKNKNFSSEELTSVYLKKINIENKDLNCFISIDESALEHAKEFITSKL